jgi:hypothetical protein
MDRFHKILILLFVAGIPAAATAPFFPAAVPLCFTAGSTTYQLSQTAASPDFRVKFDGAPADWRVALVDGVANADFTLVDDVVGMNGNACKASGLIKTVKVVGEGPSDIVIALTRDPANADFKLFVHSARFNHRDAAALFAVMRHYQQNEPVDEAAAD